MAATVTEKVESRVGNQRGLHGSQASRLFIVEFASTDVVGLDPIQPVQTAHPLGEMYPSDNQAVAGTGTAPARNSGEYNVFVNDYRIIERLSERAWVVEVIYGLTVTAGFLIPGLPAPNMPGWVLSVRTGREQMPLRTTIPFDRDPKPNHPPLDEWGEHLADLPKNEIIGSYVYEKVDTYPAGSSTRDHFMTSIGGVAILLLRKRGQRRPQPSTQFRSVINFTLERDLYYYVMPEGFLTRLSLFQECTNASTFMGAPAGTIRFVDGAVTPQASTLEYGAQATPGVTHHVALGFQYCAEGHTPLLMTHTFADPDTGGESVVLYNHTLPHIRIGDPVIEEFNVAYGADFMELMGMFS